MIRVRTDSNVLAHEDIELNTHMAARRQTQTKIQLVGNSLGVSSNVTYSAYNDDMRN